MRQMDRNRIPQYAGKAGIEILSIVSAFFTSVGQFIQGLFTPNATRG